MGGVAWGRVGEEGEGDRKLRRKEKKYTQLEKDARSGIPVP